ncbi:MAG: ABC transporter ATP-binding protein [Chloroflexi bacterium]|nr:ABC transporter ATP-binding protein [Chloroflexota bacterium]MDA0245006.1 ABC transporter ATP-binding protein [Chloroflexota bacterium]
MSFLELTNIRKVYPNGFTAVENFNLIGEQGEFISFLGPSGCGKTTTLRMIAGFEIPTAGRILVNGRDMTTTPPNKRNVGMVFQSYALFPNMSVAANIGFGLKLARVPRPEIDQRVKEMLSLIHLEEFGGRYPHQLSGGQQQRVALARALAIRPQVLLLDEPLSALDAKIRVSLREEIRAIQQKLGITTVYVTHDQEEALSISDRIVVMNQGKMEQVGTPFEIYNFPKTVFTATFVGQLNLFTAVLTNPTKGECDLLGQKLTVNEAADYPQGTAVRLALRPEELALGEIAGQNQLTGQVITRSFLGPLVRLTIAIGETELSADLFNERLFIPPNIGDRVTLSFPAQACWVVDGGADVSKK